jgi:hypothetical protein
VAQLGAKQLSLHRMSLIYFLCQLSRGGSGWCQCEAAGIVCVLWPSFPCLEAGYTDTGLSESSPALAQADSQTQGVVSLAHSLLFGCLWQQDPNNLDMWLYKKKLGMEPKVGV